MSHLADEFIRYFWALLFAADETFISDDFVCDEIERLSHELAEEFTQEEQQAVMSAAKNWLESWTAEPDQHGYSPRKLLTPDQKEFLLGLAEGKFLN